MELIRSGAVVFVSFALYVSYGCLRFQLEGRLERSSRFCIEPRAVNTLLN